MNSRIGWWIIVPMWIFIILAQGCKGEGPREEYRTELLKKFDKLIIELKELHLGDKQEETRIETSETIRVGYVGFPRSLAVIDACEQIREHFRVVSLAFLKEDIRGYDAWVKRLNKDYNKKYRRVLAQLEEIKEEHRKDPNRFYSSMAGSFLTISDGELLIYEGDFIADSRLFPIASMVWMDIDLWAAAVKEQMLTTLSHSQRTVQEIE